MSIFDIMLTILLSIAFGIPAGIFGWYSGLKAHKRGVRLPVEFFGRMDVPTIR